MRRLPLLDRSGEPRGDSAARRLRSAATDEDRAILIARALLSTAVAISIAAASAPAKLVREPKTGVNFDARVGNMSLLGVGVRTKTFLKIKVYAIGFYVADSALAGPLAVHQGRIGTSAFYHDLVTGDFEKQMVLKLVRDLSADQIQGAFRSHMLTVDRKILNQFVSYFEGTKAGQECVLHWVPGGTLETSVGGVVKPPIADRPLAQAVFAIWLADRPQEDPIRKSLVSRAAELLAACPPPSCPPMSSARRKGAVACIPDHAGAD